MIGSTAFIRVPVALLLLAAGFFAQTAPVDFGRQIRPILASRCFACHGPDAAAREADLRLDISENLTAPREGGRIVVKGAPAQSLLVQRLRATDDDRMPPAESGKEVTRAEIELIERWILEGARTSVHWSFVPLTRPAVPQAGDGWARNPVDHFVAAAQESRGLTHAPEATREQLCRRLHLDILGLPPTAAVSEAFARDERPDALARLLEQLLQSPHHAERMAMDWLDAARYADSNGYHHDMVRDMWPWRDELIAAFRRNQPMDHFMVEQIAGDLLPDATRSQKIASGFHRNVMTNSEGGAIPAEFLDQYVADRVATTGTAFLGLTLGCARCHDHKYDPISQREFFNLYAFFHQVPEIGLIDASEGNSAPLMPVPSAAQSAELAALSANIAKLRDALVEPDPELDRALQAWVVQEGGALRAHWKQVQPCGARSTGGAEVALTAAGVVRFSGRNPETDEHVLDLVVPEGGLRAVQLLLPQHDGLVGRGNNGNIVLSEVISTLLPADDGESPVALKVEAFAADFEQEGYPVAGAFDANDKTGFAPAVHQRHKPVLVAWRYAEAVPSGRTLRLQLRYQSVFARHVAAACLLRVTGDAGEAALISAPQSSAWLMSAHLPVAAAQVRGTTHDCAAAAMSGVLPIADAAWTERPELADGRVHPLPAVTGTVYLARQITLPRQRAVTLKVGSDDGLTIWLDGRKIHENPVDRAAALDADSVPVTLEAGVHTLLLRIDNTGGESGFAFRIEAPLFGGVDAEGVEALWQDKVTPSLRTLWQQHYSPRHARMQVQIAGFEAQRKTLNSMVPSTMVMGTLQKPRMTYVLKRGQYDQVTETQVQPDVPACLPPLRADVPRDRLALAHWLSDGSNPLPPRVLVNRLWQQVFGVGLVETAEDFGVQGMPPSNPELLDWLACELVDSGWDIRHVLRTIVLSATWRQSGACDAATRAKDPENRWLTRAARYRLHAELLRDQALAASGLLVPKIGGPPVRPYQPEGLWEEMSFAQKSRANSDFYIQDHGEAVWRRGMYTLVKRSVPNPELSLFDAPNREICLVRRARTNTPLQALVMLNSPTFLEAARVLAESAMAREAVDDAQRLDGIVRKLLGRAVRREESTLLLNLLAEQRRHFAEAAGEAEKLLSHGEHPRAQVDHVECAAWTMVCSVLLNLDEAQTRN